MQTQEFDIIVIGAGIVGASIARELSKYELSILVLEKEADYPSGASKANSGIIHAGYDDPPGTLRAKLCPEGNRLYGELCEELEIPFKRIGSLVVAFSEEEVHILEELLRRGKQNGVPELEIIGKDMLFKLEPNISRNAVAALWAKTAGIICPFEATIALIENAVQNGAKVLTSTPAKRVLIHEGRVVGVETPRGNFRANVVINCAGVFADEISKTAGIDTFTIKPRRGEYYILDKEIGDHVKTVTFAVPTPHSKGVIVAPTVHGNLLVGPNAQDISDKENTATTADGLRQVWEEAIKRFPKLDISKTINNYAGIRAETEKADFIIEAYRNPFGFVNVSGIRSPGLTAAPAIARYVVDLLREELGIKLKRKRNFNPRRKAIKRFAELSWAERKSLVEENPLYGRIICRCEQVTEAEIVEAIRRGAKTVDGVKFRTRAGMGRCQGGFCLPRVMEIISRELGVPFEEVKKWSEGSYIVSGKTKEG